jgi:hypothetical protein
MPLAMLVVQTVVTFVLAKQLMHVELHANRAASPFVNFASGSTFAFIGLAFTVMGPVIVYLGTNDGLLTLGYFVVRCIEGFILSVVVTASVLAWLGLKTAPTLPSGSTLNTVPVAPTSSSGPGPTTVVVNAQGVYLKISSDHVLAVVLEDVRVHGQLVDPLVSTVSVHCVRTDGTGFTLPAEINPINASSLHWKLSASEQRLKSCSGTVTLNPGYTSRASYARLSRFNLAPWNLR